MSFSKRILDLVVTNEPTVSRMGKAGNLPVLKPITELMPGATTAITLYGPALLGEKAEAGKCFMVAYLKAARQYNQGKTERNIEILAEHMNMEPAVLEGMCWPALKGDGSIDTQSILDYQSWAFQNKYVDQELAFEQMFDAQFLDYANGILGKEQ